MTLELSNIDDVMAQVTGENHDDYCPKAIAFVGDNMETNDSAMRFLLDHVFSQAENASYCGLFQMVIARGLSSRKTTKDDLDYPPVFWRDHYSISTGQVPFDRFFFDMHIFRALDMGIRRELHIGSAVLHIDLDVDRGLEADVVLKNILKIRDKYKATVFFSVLSTIDIDRTIDFFTKSRRKKVIDGYVLTSNIAG